jgi:regulator of nonsense transcripts 2
MYILSKAKPPMDVDFMVSDTFELLRPKMHIFSTYEEANAEVDLILLDQLKTVQSK